MDPDDTGPKAAPLIGLLAAVAALVAVDVGHTPSSPGSTAASGTTEYAYNLAMATRVENWLHRYGVKTFRVEPRNGNDLAGRARQAAGANLLLSIHHDSGACPVAMAAGRIGDPSCRLSDSTDAAGRKPKMSDFSGYSVWISGRNAEYAKAYSCAVDVSDSLRNGGAHPSSYHSWSLPDESRTSVATGVYRRDGLAVVSAGQVPAILVEVGVIANPDEEKWLARPAVSDAFASFVARGVVTCLNRSPQF